jgi:hypothetical protein
VLCKLKGKRRFSRYGGDNMEEKVIFAPKTVKIKGGEILIRLLRERR